MSFISSTFSNLTINVGKGLANTGVNAAFYAANYRKRDGQLKFISNRGYSNVFVYAAKRTMMQMTFVWGIERSGFFNGREKWAKGFENQRV